MACAQACVHMFRKTTTMLIKLFNLKSLFFGILIALEIMSLSRCNAVALAFNLPSNCDYFFSVTLAFLNTQLSPFAGFPPKF